MARPTRRGRAAAALLAATLALCCAAAARAASVVTIGTDANGGKYFSLSKNGGAAAPFFPRGAVVSPVVIGTNAQGAVVRQSPSQLAQEYQNAAAIGVTATRVYDAAGLCGTQTCGAVTLAAANAVGMMVLMGFKLPALETSQGFQLYVSPSWQANQAAWLAASGINATILALKSDPGLLAWTVGNEISLGAKSGRSFVVNSATGVGSWTGTFTPGWGNMWTMVNTIAGWIKALDGNHPVGTCTPNINADTVANGFQFYVPQLDFFGANVYGFAATGYVAKVAGIAGSTGWNKPFIASEYGMSNWFTTGYPTSAVAPNGWGAYAEDPSGEKAATYLQSWNSFLAAASTAAVASGGGSGGLMAGAWAFNYGWTWQASATWINLLNYWPYSYTAAAGGYDGAGSALPGAWAQGGEASEMLDTLQFMYNFSYPAVRAPSITAPGIAIYSALGAAPQYGGQNILLTAGQMYTAAVDVASSFPSVNFHWMLLPIPSGGPTDHTTYSPALNATGGTGIYAWGGDGSVSFQAPVLQGTYRLTVWATDGSGKFATHGVAFNSTLTSSPFTFPTDGDTYVNDAAKYNSQGYNAGYSNANCTSGVSSTLCPLTVPPPPSSIICWHPAASYQLVAYCNFSATTTLVAQAFRPLGSNRYPFFHFTFPGANSVAWRPTSTTLPGQAFLYVYVLSGDPIFNLTVYGVNAQAWTEANLTYASQGFEAGTLMPQAPRTPLRTLTASGGLSAWVQFDVSDYLLAQASGGANAVSFALAASSATVYNAPVMTSALLASRECGAVSGGLCTELAAPGGNGPFAAYLAIVPATAAVTMQMSNTDASSLATASLAAGRRRARALLQAPSPPGAPPAPPPAPLTAAAVAEVETLRRQLAAVAGTNVSASQVTVTVSSHSVSASILIDGAHQLDSWNPAVQQAFLLGVATDVGVDVSRIQLSFVHDTYDLSGLDVPFSVNGFVNDTDNGLSAAIACAQALSTSLTATLAAVSAAVTTHHVSKVELNVKPTIYAQISTTMAVDENAADITQALLNNAMGSGALENALRQDGVNEHVAPAGRFASIERDLGLLGCAPPAEVAALSGVAIAFIVFSGVLLCCLVSWRRRAMGAALSATAAGAELTAEQHAWADRNAAVAAAAAARKLPATVSAVRVYSADTLQEDPYAAAPPARAASPRARSSRAVTPRSGAGTPLSRDAGLPGAFA